MDVPTFREVVRILLKRHRPRNGAAKLRPFEALVSIIVSQNSTDLVTERVMADLASRVRVDPPTVAAMRAGDLVRILRPAALPLPLPGVGPKPADVWLSLVAGRDTMPMDTHIARLVRRWRLSHGRAYAEINEDLRRYVPPRSRREGHLALIYFGREVCQAPRPPPRAP